jgi:hypothetical protein
VDTEDHREHCDEGRVRINRLSQQVIGLAIEVHRELGPGMLEQAHEQCRCLELTA